MQVNKKEKGFNACPDTKPGSNKIIHVGIKCCMCSNMGHCTSKHPHKKPSDMEKELSWSNKVRDCQYQTTSSNLLVNQNWILLDSELTVHVFNNDALLNNMQQHPEVDTLILFLNGGSQELHIVGHFGGINVWYNPNSLAKILALVQIMDQF